MKYNLLIADDEYFIRKKIRKLINCDDLEINLIEEAEDGKQVLEYLEKYKIDIIILDINMPFLSGVDIVKYVNENNLGIEIIILSGYSNFEYAQTMMKYNIQFYLLKPISEELLNETLQQTIVKIKNKKLKDGFTIESFGYKLNRIIRDNESITQLLDDIPELHYYNSSRFLSIYTTDMERMISKLSLFLDKNELFFVILMEESNILNIVIIFDDKREDLKGIVSEFLNSLTFCKHFYISKAIPYREQLYQYYNDNTEKLDNRFFLEKREEEKVELLTIRNNIIRIARKNQADLQPYLKGVIIAVDNYNHLNLLVNEILISFYLCTNKEWAIDVTTQTRELLSQNYKLEELAYDLYEFAKSYLDVSHHLYSDVHLSKKMMEYVELNYMDENLSTKMLAESVGMTSSYIGSIFKKVNQMSITQYITEVRMEKAKMLLKEEYKITDIATMVGYSDVYYFSKRFKQFFGYSPKMHLNLK